MISEYPEVLFVTMKFLTRSMDPRDGRYGEKIPRHIRLLEKIQRGSSNYELRSVVVHIGKYINFGHYFAYCKGRDDECRKFDDALEPEICSWADVRNAGKSNACVLIFQRTASPAAQAPSPQVASTNQWAAFEEESDETSDEEESDDEFEPARPARHHALLRALLDDAGGVAADKFAQEIEEPAARHIGNWRRLCDASQSKPNEVQAFPIASMCIEQSCLGPVLEMLLDKKYGLGVDPNLAQSSSGQTFA